MSGFAHHSMPGDYVVPKCKKYPISNYYVNNRLSTIC